VWSMRATDLVGADGFADAIHLNADGRGAYSRRLADRLAEILQGDGG
jgi:lysophospholipase L1-like esterase